MPDNAAETVRHPAIAVPAAPPPGRSLVLLACLIATFMAAIESAQNDPK